MTHARALSAGTSRAASPHGARRGFAPRSEADFGDGAPFRRSTRRSTPRNGRAAPGPAAAPQPQRSPGATLGFDGAPSGGGTLPSRRRRRHDIVRRRRAPRQGRQADGALALHGPDRVVGGGRRAARPGADEVAETAAATAAAPGRGEPRRSAARARPCRRGRRLGPGRAVYQAHTAARRGRVQPERRSAS